MIRIALVAAVLAGTADELEPIEDELGRAIAAAIAKEADKIEKPRIKVEADPAKATGLHNPGKYGLMVVPQKELAQGEAEGYAAETGKPIGYLFLYKMLPVVEGKEVAAEKLHKVGLTNDAGESFPVHALLLSVRRAAEDDWRLYAFGPGEKPVLDAKFAPGAGPGTVPVALQSPEKGKIVLTLFDKYQARFEIAAKAE